MNNTAMLSCYVIHKIQPLLQQRQRGIVLVVSLVLLLLMTLIGVTAMQTVTLDERMVGNAHQRNVAFQAAEAGLRAGESHILTEGDRLVLDGTVPGVVDRWHNSAPSPPADGNCDTDGFCNWDTCGYTCEDEDEDEDESEINCGYICCDWNTCDWANSYDWDTASQVYNGTLNSELAAQPHYVIELMAEKADPSSGSLDVTIPPNPEYWYRVTARGSSHGSVGDAVVLLQSVYVWRP